MGRATKVSDVLTIYQFIDRSPPIRTFTWTLVVQRLIIRVQIKSLCKKAES